MLYEVDEVALIRTKNLHVMRCHSILTLVCDFLLGTVPGLITPSGYVTPTTHGRKEKDTAGWMEVGATYVDDSEYSKSSQHTRRGEHHPHRCARASPATHL